MENLDISTAVVSATTTDVETESQRADRIREEDLCEKEADQAQEAAATDQTEYDKQILTLSAGLLALLIAFIKDVVHLEHANLRWCLYTSYGLLSAAVVMVLFSFQFSLSGNLMAKEYWDDRKAKKNPEFPRTYARQVLILNRSCGVVFVLGLVLSVVFVVDNIERQAQVAKTDGTSEMHGGQIVKVPAPEQSKPTPTQTTNDNSKKK